MTETARVLVTATVFSAFALTVAAWRLQRDATSAPARLAAQLHFSQWAALVLAVQGALGLGLALSSELLPAASLEAAVGLVPIAAAVLVLRSEPRPALLLASVALGLHALTAFAHRPGWLSHEVASDGFWLGAALYDLYVGALCSWCAREGD